MGSQVCGGTEEGEGRGQWRIFDRDSEAKATEVERRRRGGEGSSVCPDTVPNTYGTDGTGDGRYGGYNEQLIDRFVLMGFDLDRVVSAFDYVGIDPNDGQDYELEEAYIGDITARLLGEP